MIEQACPRCNLIRKYHDSARGRLTVCQRCKHQFTVSGAPGALSVTEAAPPGAGLSATQIAPEPARRLNARTIGLAVGIPLALLAVAGLVWMLVGRYGTASKVSQHIQAGRAAYEKDDHDLAIVHFSEAIQKDPDNADAYKGRGDAYFQKRDDEKAIADLSKAIQLKPTWNAYNNRGNAYLVRNDYKRAAADYDEAMRLDPGSHFPYYNRGRLSLATYGDKEAVEWFTKSIERNFHFPPAYLFRAKAYVGVKKYPEALADLNVYMGTDPKSGEAFYYRGLAHKGLGNKTAAAADFDEALRYDFSLHKLVDLEKLTP